MNIKAAVMALLLCFAVGNAEARPPPKPPFPEPVVEWACKIVSKAPFIVICYNVAKRGKVP